MGASDLEAHVLQSQPYPEKAEVTLKQALENLFRGKGEYVDFEADSGAYMSRSHPQRCKGHSQT